MNKTTLLYRRVIQLSLRPSQGRVDPNPRPDVYEAICRSKAITWRTQPAHHRYVFHREQYIKEVSQSLTQVKQKLKVNELLGDSSRKTYDLQGKMKRQIPVYRFRQSIGKHLASEHGPLEDVATSVQDYLETFIEDQVLHDREVKAFMESIRKIEEGEADQEELRGRRQVRIGEKSDSDTDTERIIDLSSQSASDSS